MFSALFLRLRPAPERDTLARIFYRCFSSEDGQKILEHLHRQFVFRTNDARLPESELRFRDGQRHAVLYICALAASLSVPPASSTSSPDDSSLSLHP